MMEFKIMLITPELAKKWLEKNKVNRNINYGRVRQYAEDMKAGLWQVNGEAIQFYEDGSLANGQHRLTAITIANIPVKSAVLTGLPNNITIQDRGRNRTVTDSMLLEGYSKQLANNTNVAIAKLHYIVQTGNTNISDGTAKQFIEDNKEILLYLNEVTKRPSHCKQTALNTKVAPILLPCLYAIKSGECSRGTIKDFLDVLYTGIPTSLDQSAALVCRNDILSEAIPTKRGSATARKKAVIQIEKAIYDFSVHYPRKKSYSTWETPTYSNHANNVIN